MKQLFGYRVLGVFIIAGWLAVANVTAQTRDGNFWIPNNTVNSIIVDDSRGIVLLGGSFDYLGLFTGGSVMLHKTTGLYDQTFPVIDGTVYAAVPDGSGGMFIGGNFSSVGGITRNNLAHITSAGTVSSWAPDPDGYVYTLTIDNGILYVGGVFTSIAGQNDTSLAAFDVSTETYNATFQPEGIAGNFFASVNSLLVYGSKLYLAGSFNTIGGLARNNLAAVDKITGAVDSWDPSPAHWSPTHIMSINAIAAYNGDLFVGGSFTTIGGANRLSLAQVDTTTGTATSWDPQITPYIFQNPFFTDTVSLVTALLVKGDTLYVGGNFKGFQTQTSYGLAALHASSSTILSGAVPALPASKSVSAFSLDGTTLYVGGEFSSIGSEQRKNISAINTATGTVTSWNPTLSYYPNTIVASGSQVYVGGQFSSVNGVVRNGLAAINQSSGVPTSWNPNSTANDQTSIYAMALVDTVLYVGGQFTSFGGESRTSLAAVGISGGELLPFNHTLTKNTIFGPVKPLIYTMARSASKLYIGGSLDSVDGNRRYGTAAFELSDGSLSSWDPNPTFSGEAGIIRALAVSGNKVYLGGASFDMVGDSSRINIAAVDTGSGAVLPWYPALNATNQHVTVFAVDGSTLYVGGSFDQIGDADIHNIASFDTSSSTPNNWNPDIDATSFAIVISPTMVYIGGDFGKVGGVSRASLAAVDKTTAALTSWDAQLDDYVTAIGISPTYQKVYFGGGFTVVLGEFSQNLGAVTNPYDPALPVGLTSFTASANQHDVELLWQTATEVNNYGFEIERRNVRNVNGGIQTWTKAGFVEGHGTSNTPKEYSFTDEKLSPGRYAYRIKQIDLNGSFTYTHAVEVEVGTAPREFSLSQNFPNPFNPTTTIGFTLQASGHTTLKVYDMIGREVATLADENLEAGVYHQRIFTASNLASGIYFARLTNNHNTQIRKMLLMK